MSFEQIPWAVGSRLLIELASALSRYARCTMHDAQCVEISRAGGVPEIEAARDQEQGSAAHGSPVRCPLSVLHSFRPSATLQHRRSETFGRASQRGTRYNPHRCGPWWWGYRAQHTKSFTTARSNHTFGSLQFENVLRTLYPPPHASPWLLLCTP